MQYFDFTRLIEKYSCEFTVNLGSESFYDDEGTYHAVRQKKTYKGAIIGISDGKIHRSDGTLTDKDKYLFMFEKLPLNASEVIYRNNRYRAEQQTENAEFTGVYQYTLRYVSAFRSETGESDDND